MSSSVISENETDFDEEPPFKYTKLGADVASSTLKDSASVVRCCDEFIALGTHAGYLHLFSHSGHRIKAFKPHSASINDISLDIAHNYIATASVDGQVFVSSVYAPERYFFDMKRPMRCVALDPHFTSKASRAFVCGGTNGRLTLNEKGWLGHRQTDLQPLDKEEGTIHNCIWRDNLITWSNDEGVRLFDIQLMKLIAFIPRLESAPRPDLFRVSLSFIDTHTLVIGWGSFIRIVKLRYRHTPPLHAYEHPNLQAEIQSTMEMDAMISSVLPFDNALLVLAWLEPDGALLNDESIQDKHAQRKRASKRPELRVLTLDGEEDAEDRLPIRNFYLYGCNDYKLVPSLFPTRNGPKWGFYFMSPRDVVRVEARDELDHVQWLIDGKKFGEALEAASALTVDHSFSIDNIGQMYLQSLVVEGHYSLAAEKAPHILKQNAAAWQDFFYAYANDDKLDDIIPVIPKKEPQLDEQVYAIILHHLLQHNTREFYAAVRTWPSDIYDVNSIITAVQHELENDEKEVLLESLAELYLHNRQPGKVLPIYLKLEKYEVFELIKKHSLWTDVQYQALELVRFDEGLALSESQSQWVEGGRGTIIQLLVNHTYSIQINTVVEQLQHESRYLYLYLDALRGLDNTLVEPYADTLVELYAEYDQNKLEGYLRTNVRYNLEKAYHVCEKRDYVQEMVFILGRMGSNKRALSLIIERLGDVKRAIAFAQEQKDDELWEDLLKYSESRPAFIRALLENVGPEVDPVRLIRRIKNGMAIPGLKEALIKILQDFQLQISLLESCENIAYSDCRSRLDGLLERQARGQLGGPSTLTTDTQEKAFDGECTALLYGDGRAYKDGSHAGVKVQVKAHELQNKNKTDLLNQLHELKGELVQLRVAKVAGGSASKLTKIHSVRKSIARVLTVINQKQRQHVAEAYKGKRIPLDMRHKKTRAIRRRLTPNEKSAKTVRQHKRDIHFSRRKYAVKA
ncbi:hypothetical protein E3P99_01719 [Wallemia hederae]|uniref:Vps41 beta-propeller domain-containing protein n=1 Tax=Wallemia hederae TaxID=1540922 RepID=A0A4T0FNW3_9BASI|nr:hypothetical protein E3P99_01719 [Wallemia hederae]